MNLGLQNKRVLVTGGSNGIGFSICETFLDEGAFVAICGRTQERLDVAYTELTKKFGENQVTVKKVDVTYQSKIAEVTNQIVTLWGGLDILVANVGDGRSVPEAMPNPTQFSNTWAKNFLATEYVTRAALDHLRKSKGCVLFISSIAGIEAIGAPTDYTVAKAALFALSKSLAKKCAPDVRFNCIAPGNIYFEGGTWHQKSKDDPEKVRDMLNSKVPMKCFGEPKDIGEAAVFLCSERAKFITGSVLVIDGGQTNCMI